MKNFYIKTVELAQLSRSKICLETDDFELKVNLPYFNKDEVGLITRYSNNNNNSIFCISFLLDLNCKEDAEFSALVTGRLVEGYTYFITQAGNKLEYIGYSEHYDCNGNVYIELRFLNSQNKGVGNEQRESD